MLRQVSVYRLLDLSQRFQNTQRTDILGNPGSSHIHSLIQIRFPEKKIPRNFYCSF